MLQTTKYFLMRKKLISCPTLLLISLVILFGNTTVANATPPVKVYNDWSVFQTVQDGKKICYIGSLPIKKEGNYKKRGEPFFTVTTISGAKIPEVSVYSGYNFNTNKKVNLRIGMKSFNLFVYEDRAWANNEKDDETIILTLKAGMKMTVKGYSKLDTYSKDTYSLRGFTDAYNKMTTLCKY